jgi:hypothetical protein
MRAHSHPLALMSSWRTQRGQLYFLNCVLKTKANYMLILTQLNPRLLIRLLDSKQKTKDRPEVQSTGICPLTGTFYLPLNSL